MVKPDPWLPDDPTAAERAFARRVKILGGVWLACTAVLCTVLIAGGG